MTESPTGGAGLEARYALGDALGRGGMGEVLLARDRALGRNVALKRLLGRADGLAVERFVQEAQITGQLEHPGVVPVHDLGRDGEGRPYLAMKQVRGTSLADLLAAIRDGAPVSPGAPRDLPGLIEVFARVAETVAYAHSRGVIHRDLKPANVMVGEFGEVLVLDWGLARVGGRGSGLGGRERPDSFPDVETDSSEAVFALHTAAGTVAGTPMYMAPEQARGEVERHDPRTDVWGLGALLYEILALVPPREAGPPQAVIARAKEGRVSPPRSRSRAPWPIPGELESLVLAALRPDPGERYRTVPDLLDDLAAFRAGRPLAAHREGLARRAAKWARRHPTAAVSLSLAAAALILAGAGWGVAQALAADAARRAAQADDARAEADARVRQSAELALAQSGRIGRLVQTLGGDRRAALRAAVHEFLRARDASRARGGNDAAFMAELAPARVERYLGAFRALFLAHTQHPDRIPVGHEDYFNRGLLLSLGKQDHRAAIADYERAAQLDPQGGAVALYNRALSWAKLGERARAIEDLTRVIQLGKGLAEAHAQRGLLHQERKEHDRALADYERALQLEPRSGQRWYGRGSIRQDRGELEAALSDYDRALELDPSLYQAWYNRGIAREARGDLAGAIADYGRAIGLRPSWAEPWYNRANARRLSGDLPGALGDYDAALRLKPAWPEAHLNRGVTRIERGDLRGAVRDCDQALQARPGWAEAYHNRAEARWRMGDDAGALLDLDRALRLAPASWQAWAIRGSVLARLGRRDEARTSFAQALRLCPAASRDLVEQDRRGALGGD